jgi:hypothetical protein
MVAVVRSPSFGNNWSRFESWTPPNSLVMSLCSFKMSIILFSKRKHKNYIKIYVTRLAQCLSYRINTIC